MAAPSCSHAVVIGGSITGLLAARALADFYQRVTVLDRDALPQDPAPRKDYPPTDDAGFLEFARQLDDPAIHDWLVRAQPLSPAMPYRYPAHLRRHYSGLSRFPEGLVGIRFRNWYLHRLLAGHRPPPGRDRHVL